MEEKITTFENLECWKMGRELRIQISRIIKTFPEFEKFELVSQMRRSSRSVTHNISEGYGRYHYKENAQFCRTARGSLYELLDQINVAFDEEYINLEVYNELKISISTNIKVLNGYINYLIKKEDSKNSNK